MSEIGNLSLVQPFSDLILHQVVSRVTIYPHLEYEHEKSLPEHILLLLKDMIVRLEKMQQTSDSIISKALRKVRLWR